MSSHDEQAQRLHAVLARAHLPIDAHCMALLEAWIDQGIGHLRGADSMRVDEAEENLRRLLDDMTQQSRILRFDAIHPPNFHSAIERLCPLWPFC